MNSDPAVCFTGIEKSFFGVKVLKGVSFTVRAGSIAGLVGENGAGKSTLMNLLGGNLRPDAGELRIDGRTFAPEDPNDARAAGIAFVHQELNLFPNLSIAENLFLTDLPRVAGVRGNGLPWIDRRALRARAAGLLDQVGLTHPPDTLVERLSAGERQLVEIAKALGANARVLILDEPTTSLSTRECERLFTLMRQLRARGLALIYISHALGDVLRLCDEIVVLRDGEVVGGGTEKEFTHDRLVSLMVGRQLNQLYPERWPGGPSGDSGKLPGTEFHGGVSESAGSSPCLLQVRSLSQPGVVRDIAFSLARGEVLGISGLLGAGRSELARILFGLDPHSSGEILLEGKPLAGTPRQRIRRGLAFLTEDRRQEGLCMEAAIADNLALVTLARHARTPARWLDFAGLRSAVGRMREAVRLSPTARDAQPVRTLSGGNQQKVVLGKWLLAGPRVLILDEPTRGIDVGAKFEIYQLIHQLADRGAGVLVISSEIEELIGICDRILVMRQGEVTGEFARKQFDRERILAAALHSSKSADADAGRLPPGGSLAKPARKPSLSPPVSARPSLVRLLDFAPVALLATVLAIFGCLSGTFLTTENLTQVLIQSSATAIVAVGMTFVLLTAGVDLSVGAVMFVGAGLAGKLALAGQPLPVCLAVMVGVGLVGGTLNALLITRLKLVAFIATLATLYIGRGTGRWITQTRAMNLPDAFLALGSTHWLGIPLPLWIAGGVILLAQLFLSNTPLGRQLYALGNNLEAAKKAGLRTTRLLTAVYVLCGLCAGLGGILALAQLGAVSPRFGELYEFDAITAAVLGGTSLFGGRGKVFPGTVLGAVLLKTIFNGLVIVQADPYLYPLITSGIVFAAVLIDGFRQRLDSRGH
jgi:ABC-type sugar transport system ATPase subunit/ribose/xylose/arabinose/galactoside ABC-type transport system permease subunit